MERRILVAGFLHHGGKVLLLRRVSSKSFSPNCYERPGGHKEDNEDLQTALKREFLEETGLSITINQKYFEYDHHIAETPYAEHSFFVEVENADPIVLSPEHDEYVWVAKEELNHYKINPKEKIAILKGFESIA